MVNLNLWWVGGKIIKSLYVIEIPILLGGEHITTKIDVVDSDISFLLRKNFNFLRFTPQDALKIHSLTLPVP